MQTCACHHSTMHRCLNWWVWCYLYNGFKCQCNVVNNWILFLKIHTTHWCVIMRPAHNSHCSMTMSQTTKTEWRNKERNVEMVTNETYTRLDGSGSAKSSATREQDARVGGGEWIRSTVTLKCHSVLSVGRNYCSIQMMTERLWVLSDLGEERKTASLWSSLNTRRTFQRIRGAAARLVLCFSLVSHFPLQVLWL